VNPLECPAAISFMIGYPNIELGVVCRGGFRWRYPARKDNDGPCPESPVDIRPRNS
jgi:hypothetical protein